MKPSRSQPHIRKAHETRPHQPRPLVRPSILSSFLYALVTGSLAIGALVTTAGCGPKGTPETPPPGPGDYIESGKTKVPASVAVDRLGVVLAEGASEEQLEELAQLYKLRVGRHYPGGIYELTLSSKTTRTKLRELAVDLSSRFTKQLSYAGLVAVPKGATTPMIVPEQIIVEFRPGTPEAVMQQQLAAAATTVITRNPYIRHQFLVELTDRTGPDPLELSRLVSQKTEVAFAHPNFIPVVDYRQAVPNDPLFNNQWHHQNTGQSGGTVDADIDTPLAWEMTTGAANVIIAVIDSGFDTAHPDLTANLWTNSGEVAGNGVDDDGNGFIDDVNGWDFSGDDNTLTGGNHGTAVAGAAGATGNNALGVTGSCQRCTLMLIRDSLAVFGQALAFNYAQNNGAWIITNSWGYSVGTPAATVVVNAINQAATNGRGGLGSVVLFAMTNSNTDNCTGTTPDISALASVIAVSASSNQDRKVTESGFGNCMDVLGPTHRGYGGVPYTGTLNIVTTDVTGSAGYNNSSTSAACPSTEPSPPPANARDYTMCFGGTSAATPIVAGTAGLALAADNTLTATQVQQLLQDTADKTDDTAAAYAEATGMSAPGGASTHGFGRINAREAVRVVSETGLGGTDVYVRDNRLDWGNTEQLSNVVMDPTRGFLPHWHSVDIKVDAPPFAPTAPSTGAAFDAFVHENPIAETTNRVYVRVHNRGPIAADSVTVKLLWAFAGTALPSLPSDFWTAFPADSANTSVWHPLGTKTATNVTYSGASVAATGGDGAQILQYDFNAPALSTEPNPRHHCLLAIIDSPQDHVSDLAKSSLVVDFITPRDNNVTHRNVVLQDSTGAETMSEYFFVRNPFNRDIRTVLRVVGPKGFEFDFDRVNAGEPFELAAGAEMLVELEVSWPEPDTRGEVTVIQTEFDGKRNPVMGGITFSFGPPKHQ